MLVDPNNLVISDPPFFSLMSARLVWDTHIWMMEDPDRRDKFWTPIVVQGDKVVDGRYRVYAAKLLGIKEIEVNDNSNPSVHADVSTTRITDNDTSLHQDGPTEEVLG